MNRRWSFTPYQPSPVPMGFYDPALDAQQRAAQRGLADLRQDIGTQGTRDTVDYGLGRDDIQRQAARSLADLGTSRQNQVADIGTSRQRVDEDYQRNLAVMQQGYQRLGVRQQQQAAGAGVLDGGALLQAAAKRSSNMAQDKSLLDAQRDRALADLATQEQRLGQAADLQQGRIGEDQDVALGRLGLEAAPPDAGNPLGGRRFQDRTTQLTRAERENTQFGIDVGAQKAAQAAANQYKPARIPGRQFIDAQGNPRRIVTLDGWRYIVDRSGRVIDRSRAR